jgi:hypothetical protein
MIGCWKQYQFNGVCHEGAIFTQVSQAAAPRLQSRTTSWQGLCNLQEQPALQGTAALIAKDY